MTICECGDHFWVSATRGYIGIFSPDDASLVNGKSIHVRMTPGQKRERPYLYFSNNQRISRLIAEPGRDEVVDHINRNTVDNRRENLRVCSQKENATYAYKRRMETTSRFKGVSFCNERKNWRACIMENGKFIGLGRFTSEEDAAEAYDEAAKRIHGEFAMTNEAMGLFS